MRNRHDLMPPRGDTGEMSETPALVSLHIWGVPTRQVPTAVTHMARHRRPVRAIPGVRFAKLLGTGNGRTFTPLDADAHHWGVLVSGPTTRDRTGSPSRGWPGTGTGSPRSRPPGSCAR